MLDGDDNGGVHVLDGDDNTFTVPHASMEDDDVGVNGYHILDDDSGVHGVNVLDDDGEDCPSIKIEGRITRGGDGGGH